MVHGFVGFVQITFETLFDHFANENWMWLIAHFEDIFTIHMTEAEDGRLKIVDRLTRHSSVDGWMRSTTRFPHLSHITLSGENDRFETFRRERRVFSFGHFHQTFQYLFVIQFRIS